MPFKRNLITEDGRFDETEYTRRWAWFIATQIRQHRSLAEISEKARMNQTAIRRYGTYEGEGCEAWGPKKIGETTRLVYAFGFCPGKVAYCLRLAGDKETFWSLMNAVFVAEQMLSLDQRNGAQIAPMPMRLG